MRSSGSYHCIFYEGETRRKKAVTLSFILGSKMRCILGQWKPKTEAFATLKQENSHPNRKSTKIYRASFFDPRSSTKNRLISHLASRLVEPVLYYFLARLHIPYILDPWGRIERENLRLLMRSRLRSSIRSPLPKHTNLSTVAKSL